MEQRRVQQVDVETGEVMQAGVMVYIAQRPKIREGFVMTFQDGLVRLATDRSITGEQWRVLALLMGKLDFENYIHLPQASICEALNMKAPNVSRAIAELVKKGVLVRGPKVGRVGTLRLSPGLGWKGRVRSLQEERKRRLALVHTTPPPSSGGKAGHRRT